MSQPSPKLRRETPERKRCTSIVARVILLIYRRIRYIYTYIYIYYVNGSSPYICQYFSIYYEGVLVQSWTTFRRRRERRAPRVYFRNAWGAADEWRTSSLKILERQHGTRWSAKSNSGNVAPATYNRQHDGARRRFSLP